jgi:peroxiredoxin Q/BCP
MLEAFMLERRMLEPHTLKKLLVTICLVLSTTALASPQVGDLAPDWSLPGSDGKTYTLSELRGHHVVVAFFPKAFTGG